MDLDELLRGWPVVGAPLDWSRAQGYQGPPTRDPTREVSQTTGWPQWQGAGTKVESKNLPNASRDEEEPSNGLPVVGAPLDWSKAAGYQGPPPQDPTQEVSQTAGWPQCRGPAQVTGPMKAPRAPWDWEAAQDVPLNSLPVVGAPLDWSKAAGYQGSPKQAQWFDLDSMKIMEGEISFEDEVEEAVAAEVDLDELAVDGVVDCLGLSAEEEERLRSLSGAGLDYYAPYMFRDPEECDWVYMGYAIKMLENPLNIPLWEADRDAGDVPDAYSESNFPYALGYHVRTTSTSTVQVDGTWRIYFPTSTNGTLFSDEDFTVGYPKGHPSLTTNSVPYDGTTGVKKAPWLDGTNLRPQFKTGYFAFVDSRDGGASFHIYGPVYDPTVKPYWIWDKTDYEAGWASTVIPTEPVLANDGSGTYVRYADITVLDLRYTDGSGYYVAICVECRSTTAATGDSCCTKSCDTACQELADVIVTTTKKDGVEKTEYTPAGTTQNMPATRVVMFMSASGDFASDIFPDPTWPSAAVVLVEQDEAFRWGNMDGHLNTCCNEWYGVPHAVQHTYTDGSGVPFKMVVLYTQWRGLGIDGSYLPGRVRSVYPDSTYKYNANGTDQPPWNSFAGISCFTAQKASLQAAIVKYQSAYNPLDPDAADSTPIGETLTYRGEVLVTDGVADATKALPSGASCPNNLETIDPHLFAQASATSGMDDDLIISFNDISPNTNSQSRMRLATMVSSTSTLATDYAAALAANITAAGALPYYTIFQIGDCDVAFDMRQAILQRAMPERKKSCVFGDLGLLLSDQDVAILDPVNGCMRVSFHSMGAQNDEGQFCLSPGLVYALKAGSPDVEPE